MTTSTPDIQPAVQHTVQVAIAGAGPVGLMMANYLGQMGISVLLVEKLDTLIDYPRAIGIDDESLRAMQAVGLVNDVLPHTTPWHAMRFLTPKGRCFADIQPMTDEFGWSRRNAFIQPQVDAVMYHGLQRFPQVRCLFSREVEAFSQNGDGVTLNLKGPDGERETVRADWLVACDGGASFIRRTLNVPFEGKTAPNQWIVIDIANDPLATPHVYLCCDPVRPYVSAALPHGVRRFEFMVMPGETEAQLSEPHNMRRLLSKVLPDPDRVELIRQRVYTHNARLAERFRIDRVLLAGDAAHIMPVWQGQGYNSGMRDAFNLAWKLALVVNGKAGEALLDSYQQERRDHAKAMIDLSVTAGHVLAPPKRWQGAVRDGLSWLLNYLPPVKRYFLEMRFKPMPQYREGALLIDAAGKTVLPGLIDTHLHFSGNLTDDDTDWVMQPLLEKQAVAVKQAYDCLTHGLTTVCEIGRFGIQIRDCIDKGVFKGPRVLATGLGFCRVAGHGDSHHCTQELNKESHPWGDQVDGPWDLRKAVRRRLRENPDAIKIWATGGGIWRWDSGRDQHYCSEEIQAVVEEAKMVGIPVWSHCYNNHAAAYDSVRFGCEQLIHGFDIDERTMDLMAEQGTFFTPTIAFLPTWYATYPPVYVPELHDKYEGTLVEKELQRNYDCLREAKKRGVVMTIGSDSFSFVTPYGTCSIEEMYEFVDKIGFTPVETITCATLNGAKMCHIEDETGSIEAGKCADLLVVNGDVAADIHVLNTDNMDVIMKDGWIIEAGTFGEANKYSA